MSTNKSYSASFHTANPYEAYPKSVFGSDTKPEETPEGYVKLAERSTSAYLNDLNKQAEEQAKEILRQYELAKKKAQDEKNNLISLAQQEYFKNTNPYGVRSENLSTGSFDKSGGYAVSNAQSSYANYINTKNVANSKYQDAVTDLAIDSIDAKLDNDYYYNDLKNELMGGLDDIYDKVVSSQDKADEAVKENILSAIEFVETLYSVSPTKVGTANAELESYLERIYGVTGEDFKFIVNSVTSLMAGKDKVDSDYYEKMD